LKDINKLEILHLKNSGVSSLSYIRKLLIKLKKLNFLGIEREYLTN